MKLRYANTLNNLFSFGMEMSLARETFFRVAIRYASLISKLGIKNAAKILIIFSKLTVLLENQENIIYTLRFKCANRKLYRIG